MIEYKQATLDDKEIKELINLSILWVEEDCSYGMVANTKEDIKEPCFIALDNNKIVGYIFGHYYEEKERRSYIEVGSSCFEVDELYVLKNYRSQGIGRTLFKMLEDHVKANVEYITLATSTKDYQRTLNFYVNNNDMNYHSSWLIKKMK